VFTRPKRKMYNGVPCVLQDETYDGELVREYDSAVERHRMILNSLVEIAADREIS